MPRGERQPLPSQIVDVCTAARCILVVALHDRATEHSEARSADAVRRDNTFCYTQTAW